MLGILSRFLCSVRGPLVPRLLLCRLSRHPMSAFGSTSAILVRSDVLEVGDSTIADVAIFVVEFVPFGSWTNPSFGDEDVAVRSSDEVAHPRIVGMDVGFGMEVLSLVVMNFVESSGREGEEPALFGTIELGDAYSWDCVLAEADLGAIRQK